MTGGSVRPIEFLTDPRPHASILTGMLNKLASVVLGRLNASTYMLRTPQPSNSLRLCWANFLNIPQGWFLVSVRFHPVPFSH